MDIFDALRVAVKEGKKVRISQWGDGHFVYWNGHGFTMENGRNWEPDSIFSWFPNKNDEWKVYEPPVEFASLAEGDQFLVGGSKPFMKIKLFNGMNFIRDNNTVGWMRDGVLVKKV